MMAHNYLNLCCVTLTIFLIALSSSSIGKNTNYKYGNKQDKFNTKDVFLRADLLDTATRFFHALEILTTEGNLNFWFNEMEDILADDFLFPPSVEGERDYTSKDEFLDLNTGFHIGQLAQWDVVSSLMGSNILYFQIGHDEIEMRFPKRTLIYRFDCSTTDDIQEIVNEGIDFLKLRLNYKRSKWEIYEFDDHTEKHQEIPCDVNLE